MQNRTKEEVIEQMASQLVEKLSALKASAEQIKAAKNSQKGSYSRW